jgi:hypothetical protein
VLRLALSPNGPKWPFTWALSPRSTIGSVHNDLSWWYIWRKPCTYLAPKLTLSPNGKKRDSTWPTSPRGSIGWVQNDFQAYGTFDANNALILRPNGPSFQLSLVTQKYHRVHPKWFLTDGMCSTNHAPKLNWRKHYLQRERSEIAHDPRHLGVALAVSKTNFEPMVRLTQTMHLSCVKVSSIAKGPKRASTWASSPSGTIECVQNNFLAYDTSSANHSPILH